MSPAASGGAAGSILVHCPAATRVFSQNAHRDGAGLGQHGGSVDLFLLGAGAMTALPLMAYVAASRLLPLTALGLVFYIGPTTQLLVALLVFREPFDRVQALAFGLVWAGLLVVTWDSIRRARALRRRVGKSV